MWFSLFAAVLILAIAFYQGLLGLFSAVINCILTVLAAALAFGLYEDIYYSYLLERQPDDGRGIALLAIFVVSLLVMRFIVDLVITENMKFPMYADRIGGGLLGLVTALIIIGVLGTGIQMLPFPHQWLGFSRYAMVDAETGALVSLTPNPKNEKETEQDVLAKVDLQSVRFARRKLWLNPDGFAVSVASYLSDNALAGSNRLSRAHPELLDEEHWARFTTLGQNTSVARKPEAITVESCWELPAKKLRVRKDKEGQASKYDLVDPPTGEDAGFQLIAVRATKLTKDATDDGTNFRFTTNQVRLFTQGKAGRTVSYGLAGINVTPENLPAAANKDVFYRLRQGETVVRTTDKFNFVFEIPDDTEPLYVVFRRNARAEIRAVQKEKDAPKTALFATPGSKGPGKAVKATEDGKNTTDNSTENQGTDNRGGRLSRVHSKLEGSFFGDQLPFELTSYTDDGIEVVSGALSNGRLKATLNDDDTPVKGPGKPVKRIDIAKDKRLLQLNMERVFPGSLLGQVFDFAKQNNPIRVKIANDSKPCFAVGMYLFGTVGGKRTFELVYFDDEHRQSAAGVPKPQYILKQHMKPGDEMFYLFEVPPGAEILSFVNPSNREEDLRSAKLVAPM